MYYHLNASVNGSPLLKYCVLIPIAPSFCGICEFHHGNLIHEILVCAYIRIHAVCVEFIFFIRSTKFLAMKNLVLYLLQFECTILFHHVLCVLHGTVASP